MPQALPPPLYWCGPAGGTCAIHRPCADCQVRDQSLCGSLSDEELHSLNAIGRHRKLERGQTLLWAGDDALLCANLLSGVLKLSAATADGREQIVGLLYPADFVGRPFAEGMLFRAAHAYETATAWRGRRPAVEPGLVAAQ